MTLVPFLRTVELKGLWREKGGMVCALLCLVPTSMDRTDRDDSHSHWKSVVDEENWLDPSLAPLHGEERRAIFGVGAHFLHW